MTERMDDEFTTTMERRWKVFNVSIERRWSSRNSRDGLAQGYFTGLEDGGDGGGGTKGEFEEAAIRTEKERERECAFKAS